MIYTLSQLLSAFVSSTRNGRFRSVATAGSCRYNDPRQKTVEANSPAAWNLGNNVPHRPEHVERRAVESRRSKIEMHHFFTLIHFDSS